MPPDETLTELVFRAAVPGTSDLRFVVDTLNTGDCEILVADPVLQTLNDLGIPCLDGMAQFSSTR